jgi:hypothetical protein
MDLAVSVPSNGAYHPVRFHIRVDLTEWFFRIQIYFPTDGNGLVFIPLSTQFFILSAYIRNVRSLSTTVESKIMIHNS